GEHVRGPSIRDDARDERDARHQCGAISSPYTASSETGTFAFATNPSEAPAIGQTASTTTSQLGIVAVTAANPAVARVRTSEPQAQIPYRVARTFGVIGGTIVFM